MNIKSQRGSASLSEPFMKFTELIVPWVLFLVLLLWGWRVGNLFHTIPAYMDVLEVVWGVMWYDNHLLDGQLLFYPLIFHPEGWYVATLPHGPGVFIPLLPLYKFGGAAFAYNSAVLISFLLTFAGMHRLTRKLAGSFFVATVASLLYTFWGLRWLRISGHLNMLLGSSLFPWMVWGLEQAFYSPRRSRAWFVLVGAIWALAIASSLYFLWLGGLVLLGWIAGRYFSGQVDRRTALNSLITSTLAALLLSAPVLLSFIQGYTAAGASSFDIYQLNFWGASLNSIPIPFVFHPWLKSLARWLYQGGVDESGVANFGFGAFLIALMSLRKIRQDKDRWPALILAGIGIVLALGFTLKWDGGTIQWDALRPLNSVVWQVAHRLKPGLFTFSDPPSPFNAAILMPELGLAALVPFWEGARTVSRFALVAGVGFFLLVSQEVGRLHNSIARLVVGALLIIEVIPPPSGSVPFPPPSHPAFEWLRQQTFSQQEGIIDLSALQPYVVAPDIRGEILWATRYHKRATASGVGSVWPAHVVFLHNWFLSHSHPFQNPELIPLLRKYKVRYILLHMQGKNEQNVLEEAQLNEELEMVKCFDPPSGISPWPYPICVLRILPP